MSDTCTWCDLDKSKQDMVLDWLLHNQMLFMNRVWSFSEELVNEELSINEAFEMYEETLENPVIVGMNHKRPIWIQIGNVRIPITLQ